MSTQKNLITLCFATVFTLGLAACGGGGGGGGDAPVNGNVALPGGPPELGVEVADLMYLDEDNAPMAGTMMVAAGEMATNNGVIFMCPAGGDDCEVTVNADGSATSTGGAATATLSADAILQVAQAKQDAKDVADLAVLENRDRIIGKNRALETFELLELTGFVSLPGQVGEDDEIEILISRADDAMASVTSAGYTTSDDPALPNGDWAGTRLMQSVTGATNHLFVYTDIEEATRVEFYESDNDPMTLPRYVGDEQGRLPIGGVGQEEFSATTADLEKFPAPQSAEEGSHTQLYQFNDYIVDPVTQPGDAAPPFDQVNFPGNYNGAGGRYICTGGDEGANACSVKVAPNGEYTPTGTWLFVPELNATAWQGDGEFMIFGWWLQEPTAQTGTYTFRYYAGGTTPYVGPTGTDDDNLAAGSATYDGRAAGKFVVQEIDNTGVVDGEAGMFTAAASLTASFNGTGAGGSLEGTVSGFQSDNAGVDVSGWSVTLNSQTLIDTATSLTSMGTNDDDPTASGFDGSTAMMGDQTAHGTWSSQFFGQQPNTDDAYPLGVGGVFQADNEAASIAGAFGARK